MGLPQEGHSGLEISTEIWRLDILDGAHLEILRGVFLEILREI